jgi:putative glutathione S-transferase
MLVDGKWTEDWQPVQKADAKGGFVRQTSSFRNWITPDGSAGPTGEGGFKAEAGRYHLYVALICPWASRTLIARKPEGLETLIPVTVVSPRLTSQGWQFGDYPRPDADPLFATYMHEIYTRADAHVPGAPRCRSCGTWPACHGEQRIRRYPADVQFGLWHLGRPGPDLYPEAAAPARSTR